MAPKTIQRLEKISMDRYKKRQEEEEEEDDGDDDSIKILDEDPVSLDDMDIQVLDKPLKLKNNGDLLGVEVLNA